MGVHSGDSARATDTFRVHRLDLLLTSTDLDLANQVERADRLVFCQSWEIPSARRTHAACMGHLPGLLVLSSLAPPALDQPSTD